MIDLDGDRLASVGSVNLTQTLGEACPAAPVDPPSSSQRDSVRRASAAATAHYPCREGGEALSLRPPTEPSERRIVGACFHELKARAMTVAAAAGPRPSAGSRPAAIAAATVAAAAGVGVEHGVEAECAGGRERREGGGDGGRLVPPAAEARPLEPWLMPLVTAPEGFLVEVEGAVLRAGHGRALGQRLDNLALQTKALAVAFAQTPGRWEHLLRSGVARFGRDFSPDREPSPHSDANLLIEGFPRFCKIVRRYRR